MNTIAVTGGNGMAGRHMCAWLELQKQPYKRIQREEWNIAEWKTAEQLDQIFSGSKAIFHFAAALPSPVDGSNSVSTQLLFDVNVRACLNLAEWANLRKIPLIFISGSTVYRNPHERNILETSAKVINGFGGFYGYSKWLAEQVIEHYMATGLDAIILRPTSIYGYGLASDKLIQNFLNKAEQDEIITIDAPDNKVNLIHALDVAKAAWQAYQQKAWGEYNIAGFHNYSIIEIAKTALTLEQKGQVKVLHQQQEAEAYVRFDLNYQKAKNSFGFTPSIDLQTGMGLMMQKREIPC